MAKLFEPMEIGTLRARNRLVRAATAESLATADGRPTPDLIRIYRTLAQGGVGTMITGYAFVSPDGKPSEGALGLCDDGFGDDYRALVAAAHEEGARIVAQLVYGGSKSKVSEDDARRLAHAGDLPRDGMPNVDIVGPSALVNPKTGLVPREAADNDLQRIVRAFGSAAARARAFGFDGVEIHAAHGYLLSQFLSRRSNVRADAYGGRLENRARLAVECVRSARDEVGEGFPVLVKLNCRDDFDDPAGVHGGLGEDESMRVAQMLVEAGASCIDVSGDWHAVKTGAVDGTPFFGDYAERLAREMDAPVIATGGWRNLDVIEASLQRGALTGIAMSRPLICEPALANRWAAGHVEPSACTTCGFCLKHRGIPCSLGR